MSIFSELVSYIASFLRLLTPNYNEAVVKEGLRECAKAIRRLNYAMKTAKNIGEKQHLEACLRSVQSMKVQLKAAHKKGSGIISRPEGAWKRVHWDDVNSAFNSRIRTGSISNLKHKDPIAFLKDCKAIFKRRIHTISKKEAAVKVNVAFGGEFEIVKGDQIVNEFKYFTTTNSPIYKDTNIDDWFDTKVVAPILKDLEEFQERDSGWALKKVVNLGVNINKYTPQLGSSYIDLPAEIKKRKACINVNNEDDSCFAWAVTSALYPVRTHSDRISSYPHYSTILKLKGIQFPMTMKQIPNFEKQNGISINIYILQKYEKSFITLPTYLTRNKMDNHVNLLMVQDRYDEAPTKYHFVWIKNLSRLLSSQLSKEGDKKYFCDGCLRYFRSQEKLDVHLKCCKGREGFPCERCLQAFTTAEKLGAHAVDCLKINDCAVKMPEQGKNVLKFKNFKNKVKAPFIVYADLESVLKQTGDSKKPQQHIPAAVGYYFKCSYDDTLSFYKSYLGQDCMRWFADELNMLAQDISTVFLCPYGIHMTPSQERQFQAATECHICEKPFSATDKKVRDHDHLIPENNYRGAAHEGCNINYQDSPTVNVVFHNLSGYDANFIIEDIATRMDGSIDLLPITKEKYISFTKHVEDARIRFRFIDSFLFMASSLDKLASYLTEFPNLRSQFSSVPKEEFTMLTKKGVMPYDYFNSFDRFEETRLPPIESFYNNLEDKPCSRKLYSRAQRVWNTFQCQTLGEYVELYMKTDILLFADVFEQFRSSCITTYNIDPAHYYTLPGFTFDAMLKHTGQELELLTDVDMFLFVERGIRGGLSQVCGKRRARANNKYMPTYNPSNPSKYLMYYDVNNQYGWAMSQALPYGGFEWCDSNIDVTQIADDASEGYMLEVDLEYPCHLHHLHKDIPFCPEHLNPKTVMPATRSNEETKLMGTLTNKAKYVIHYRALKQALQNGLVLTKIHQVLKFKQSSWLKPYIDLNTELRRAAKNEFEKNLFKLMNNAVFGKTMENVRKRVDLKLISHWSGRYGAESYIAKPEFKNSTIFSENLVAIELRKLQIWLNKPIYVGMAILDLAKTTIYDFHYEYMANRFSENYTVLYTDTDSLIYEIGYQDPYEVMKIDCYKYFDTSDYPLDNVYGIPQVNKKVLGMMKNENNGIIMTDYIGLRSKLYATRLLTSEDGLAEKRKRLANDGFEKEEIDCLIRNVGITKKAKGVKSSVVKTVITFEDYEECLDTFTQKTVTQNLIRAEKHLVHSIVQDKIALSPFDDKRFILPGSDETLPWGHYSIDAYMDVDTIIP